MSRVRIGLVDVVLVVLALPAWGFLIWAVPQGTGWGGNPFRYLAAPVALTGIAGAVYYLLRDRRYAWAISMFVSGYGAIAFLYAVRWAVS